MPDRSVDGHDGSKNQAGILSPATPRPAARKIPNQLFTILYTMLYTPFYWVRLIDEALAIPHRYWREQVPRNR